MGILKLSYIKYAVFIKYDQRLALKKRA